MSSHIRHKISATTKWLHRKQDKLRRKLASLDVEARALPRDNVSFPSPTEADSEPPLPNEPSASTTAELVPENVLMTLEDLDHLREGLLRGSLTVTWSGAPLVFRALTSEDFVRNDPDPDGPFNVGRCALDPHRPENQQFLFYYQWLQSSLQYLHLLLTGTTSSASSIHVYCKRLASRIREEILRLEDIKEIEWEAAQIVPVHLDGNGGDIPYVVFDTRRFYTFQSASWDSWTSPIKATSVMAATFNLLYGLSRRTTGLLLAGMHDTVRLTLEYARGGDGGFTAEDKRLMRFIHRDPRTVVNAFGLDPSVHEYVCCPDCFALYDCLETAPKICSYRSTPSSEPCGAKLWKKRVIRGKEMRYPSRRYLHQWLKHWLGRMLSHAETEAHLEKLHLPPQSGQGLPAPSMSDIFDAPGVHAFKGPDQHPFLTPGRPDELRLIFTLSADGFNPYQMKEAKQSVTSTAIYMVCLNLPPHLRYLPHNMYLVGVIPGPTKPSTEQINHFLRPLVDELLEFWDPGIYYSRTAKFPRGRLARVAMLLLVCDLVAARQLSGFGQHNHTFAVCSLCHITKHEIEETDLSKFRKRRLAEHREAAHTWLNAGSTLQREALFKSNGIRYTELLRLPYWNPFLYTVVDTMHNLYLGVIKRHILDFWGVKINEDDSDAAGEQARHTPRRPSDVLMATATDTLLYGTFDQLVRCSKGQLFHLCVDRGLRFAGTRKVMARTLSTWRYKEGLPAPPPAPPAPTSLGPEAAGQPATQAPAELPAPSAPQVPPILHTATTSQSPADASPALTPSVLTWTHPDQKVTFSAANYPNWTEDEISRLQKAYNLLMVTRSATNFAKTATRKPLVELCRLSCVDMPSQDVTNAKLANLLIAWRDHHRSKSQPQAPVVNSTTSGAPTQTILTAAPQVSANATVPVIAVSDDIADPTQRKQTAAIGKQTLQEYVKDRSRVELPSWINPAPTAFGTTRQGKLSADQWRTLATVHLPVTLIRTWGIDGDSRHRKMLENFLDLVDAVETLGLLEIDETRIAEADALIKKYLDGAKELYKGAPFQPNHHMCLHLGVFLMLFGPAHSWRAFAFERFNYMLQTLNTNLNFGELEMTMMMTSCRAANLHALLELTSLRDALPAFTAKFEQLSAEDRRGSRLDAIARSGHGSAPRGVPNIRPQTVSLRVGVYRALLERLNQSDKAAPLEDDVLPRTGIACNRIAISGVFFKPRRQATGDSNVLFVHPSLRGASAGIIDEIFLHTRTEQGRSIEETFLSVWPLVELTVADAQLDPFRKYTAGGCLYYNEYGPQLLVVRPEDILCHVARTPMDDAADEGAGDTGMKRLLFSKPCVHIKRLDRLLRVADKLEEQDSGTADDIGHA